MHDRTSSRTLLLGLLLSLVLHATLLVPALMIVMSGEGFGPGRVLARFEPDDFVEPQDEELMPDESVPLGIDESQESTMTWIGYEEYEEHLAALAETEQAAFTTDPTGGAPAEAAASPAPPAEPTPPSQAEAEPGATTDPMAELEAWLEAMELGPGPLAGDPTDPKTQAKALDDILANLEQMLSEQAEPKAQPETSPPQPPQPQQPQQTAEASDAPAQPTPPGVPADSSDQESDPTSTVDVPLDNIRLGKPLAAHGLQIKPRRPVFTTLTMLTAAPANPLAELHFRRDGKPQRVRILETSGDGRIDEAILNSLYRWRAAGKRLKPLKKGETIPIKIRIVLFAPRE
ncbi:MAG: energy transducer TonB [Planctomycetota bacterium]|jgi:hypothetical protein